MLNEAKLMLKKLPPLFYLIKWTYLAIGRVIAAHQWRALAQCPHIRLELGSGAKRGTNGWVTVDLRGADINYDLQRGIALKDSSVDAIYTSHMFEHIPYSEMIALIAECHRVLKKGCYLSVCVPNAAHYIRAYMEKRQFEDISKYYDKAMVNTGSFLDQVNYIAYMDNGHRYLFDEENLINTLKKGGFIDVKLRVFDPQVDSVKFDYVSIYAIATK